MADIRKSESGETLFCITMNMPARSGNMTHMIMAAAPGIKTAEEFAEFLDGKDFVIVEEHYRREGDGDYFSVGPICLNVMYIGKVKACA